MIVRTYRKQILHLQHILFPKIPTNNTTEPLQLKHYLLDIYNTFSVNSIYLPARISLLDNPETSIRTSFVFYFCLCHIEDELGILILDEKRAV